MANQDYLMSEEEVSEKMPGWEPDTRPGPTSPSAPPPPNTMPGYFQGSLPPTTQHDTTFIGTEVGTPRIPKTSLMPLSPQSNAFTNAASQSTAQTVAQSTPSDAQLQISQFNHGINANANTVLAGNGTWVAKTDVVQFQVDFGFQVANEGDDAFITVSAPWVQTGSVIVCSAAMEATADHDPDDVWAERIVAYAANIVPGVGFDLYATSANEGGRTWGKYLINAVGY
jgi:hypothetical protein